MFRLQYERHRNKWSQTSVGILAHRCGYHRTLFQSEISLYETGRLTPSGDELEALGRVFGITPASLLLKEVVLLQDEVGAGEMA